MGRRRFPPANKLDPMLRGMRKASSNWLGKIIMATVMGVLIISFGIWGIADIFRGFGQSTLAKVGRTEISTEQFRQIYTDRLQQVGRQFGRPLTADQARALGFDRQVLQQTIAEAALDEEARRLGLGQSDEETLKTIFSDPTFKGVNGSFDPSRFQNLMRQMGYSEQHFIAEQRRVSLRRQIAGSIAAGLEPSKVLLDALARFGSEQRSIEYVKLGAAQAGTIDPPSPEALAAYFEDHKTLFRAPEYRKIAFVAVTPEEIGKWTDVSDDDAKQAFEQRRDKLGTPERREVQQIIFPNADEATAARNRLSSGLSFEDLAKERGLGQSDIDLGLIAKSAIGDPAIADAAFALPSCEVSQPAKGNFGFALVKVGKIDPGVTPTYESFASQIKRDIANERARAKVGELRDKMEDERGGGASVVEAAQPSMRWTVLAACPTVSPRRMFPVGWMWFHRPSTPMSASTTTRSSSTAAMSGTMSSASPRRANATWTRSRIRSRRGGGPNRSRAGCAPRLPKWLRSSTRAASSPMRRRRPG
jgi:peptidyl-prolyl cis-trans isomerase D